MNPKQKIGIDFKNEGTGNELTSEEILKLATQAENQGFDCIWLNEDIGKDSVALFGAISIVTKSIGLGTAILNVYSRSALQIAMAIATLDELSQGRARLGLSIGHHPWNDLGHGIPLEAPLARLREYVTFIRKALSGERFTHDGRFFSGVNTRLGFRPPRPDLPIYIGATRLRMVALAGEIADGLITNVVTPYYISNFQVERLREAAKKAGRGADNLELTAIVTCCPAENRQTALADARSAFMQRFRTNPARMVETQHPDFREELLALKDLVDRGELERAQQEASEQLVTSLIAVGSGNDLLKAVNRYFTAGCTRIALAAYPRDKKSIERLLMALGTMPKDSLSS
ncbi:MAG: LLM class flavin-dependent oxidoreductase [Deltaproteobacteria bacterium]|nr:LLM class flavin-dependent oxidoreductase [Deltaproteobacteria bacterium]